MEASSRTEMTEAEIIAAAKALDADRQSITHPTIAEARLHRASHVARYERAARLLSGIPPGPVVDAATGTGYGAAVLAEMLPECPEIWALDCNQVMLAYARLHFKDPRIAWRSMDLANRWNLPLESGSLAGFVSIETIEHLVAPGPLLAEAYRLLRLDGLLILTTPHIPQGSPHHVHEYTLPEIEGIVRGYGFEIITQEIQVGTGFTQLERESDLRGRFMFFVGRKAGIGWISPT